MSSADDIVKGALYMIGAHSEVMAADPSLLEKGRKKLVAMLHEHVRERIHYGSKLDSLTSVGTTATGTLVDHDFQADEEIHISGAAEDEYNGDHVVVDAPTADTFTYELDEEDDSPATDADENFGIRVLGFPDELGDEVMEDDAATEALESLLAVRMGPTCRVPVPDEVATAAANGLERLKNLFQLPDVPAIVPSRLLPRGQGSSRGTTPSTFFAGDAVDDDPST